jgi:hypothetical protein
MPPLASPLLEEFWIGLSLEGYYPFIEGEPKDSPRHSRALLSEHRSGRRACSQAAMEDGGLSLT